MKKWEVLEEGLKKLGGEKSGHHGHQGGVGGPGNPGGSRASGGGVSSQSIDIREPHLIANEIEEIFKKGQSFHSGEWNKVTINRQAFWNLKVNEVDYLLRGRLSQSYQTSGRLRIPSGTTRMVELTLTIRNPAARNKFYDRQLYRVSARGEDSSADGRVKKAEDQGIAKVQKVFGIDGFDYS